MPSTGSFGGPDGITPSHKLNMFADVGDDKLISFLINFVNTLLSGVLPLLDREIVFGGWLIAL